MNTERYCRCHDVQLKLCREKLGNHTSSFIVTLDQSLKIYQGSIPLLLFFIFKYHEIAKLFSLIIKNIVEFPIVGRVFRL